MKIDNNWIEHAIRAIEVVGIVKNSSYSKEYKGYISSFGAAIIQSGLLPAVIFYENSSSSSEDKNKIIQAIVLVLNNVAQYRINERCFSRYIIDQKDRRYKILADVNKAAIAIKLALRTFKSREE